MLEKLLLAATLTFALSFFTELNRFSPAHTATEKTEPTLPTFTITQRHNQDYTP
ncbi:MAG: hypothetical protein HC862_28615 [Scytonema sp. RU_4_4]|nr:hypothetical protein [Scytonema sp. RU_4_4]